MLKRIPFLSSKWNHIRYQPKYIDRIMLMNLFIMPARAIRYRCYLGEKRLRAMAVTIIKDKDNGQSFQPLGTIIKDGHS